MKTGNHPRIEAPSTAFFPLVQKENTMHAVKLNSKRFFPLQPQHKDKMHFSFLNKSILRSCLRTCK